MDKKEILANDISTVFHQGATVIYRPLSQAGGEGQGEGEVIFTARAIRYRIDEPPD